MAVPSANLYVRDLPEGSTEEVVHEIFGNYGNVVSVKVLGTGHSAMVKLSAVEDAQWVVENVSGNIPQGLDVPLIIRFANAPGEKGKGGKGGGGAWGAGGAAWGGDGGEAGNGAANGGWGATNAQKAQAWTQKAQGMVKEEGAGNRYAPYGAAGGAAAGGGAEVPSNNLYVKDLPEGTDEATVREIFEQYGTVVQCKVLGQGFSAMVRMGSVDEAMAICESVNGTIPHPNLPGPIVVKFANSGGAKGGGKDWGKGASAPAGGGGMTQMAVAGLKGGKGGVGKGGFSMSEFVGSIEQMGNVLPGGKAKNDENTLYIAGLPQDTTPEDLYRLFSPFGAIAPGGSAPCKDNTTGICKGIGFVHFLDNAAASLAVMTLNGTVLPDGKQLIVKVKGDPTSSKSKGKGKGAAMLQDAGQGW